MMSLIQFDEMYNICCGMMEDEERMINVDPTIQKLALMKDCIPDSNRWWEAVVEEILKEKESELLYV